MQARIASLVGVVVIPLIVSIVGSAAYDWLKVNIGSVADFLRSPWLPFGLFVMLAFLWLAFWLLVEPRLPHGLVGRPGVTMRATGHKGPPRAPATESAPSSRTADPTVEAGVIAPESPVAGQSSGDVTPEYLWSLFEGRTDIEARVDLARFLSKPITVSGVVGDIEDHSPWFVRITNARSGTSPNHIYMDFETDWLERLRPINPGTRITVRGNLADLSEIDMHLNKCEIVRLGP